MPAWHQPASVQASPVRAPVQLSKVVPGGDLRGVGIAGVGVGRSAGGDEDAEGEDEAGERDRLHPLGGSKPVASTTGGIPRAWPPRDPDHGAERDAGVRRVRGSVVSVVSPGAAQHEREVGRGGAVDLRRDLGRGEAVERDLELVDRAQV